MMNFYKHKGFTLIELMLVITVVLILMGFLVPKVSAYQDKARSAKAMNTAKQIQTAALASYGNNDSKFDRNDVKETIIELTSVGESASVSLGSDEQTINITYDSDGKSCAVKIAAKDNTYEVTYDGKLIFPRQSKINNTKTTPNK